jgi:short-subunit dehydrogenase
MRRYATIPEHSKKPAVSAKTVVITGASSGIGASIAVACAAGGMNVVLAARRMQALEVTAAACRKHGVEALPVVTDIRSRESIDALIAAAIDAFGGIDVFVANAGIGFHTPLTHATDEELREAVDVNILGTMRCARAVAPHMIARGSGHIFTVSSVSIELMWPDDSVYGSTKAAIHRFASGLRNELAPYGVDVTDVIPGVIETPLTEGLSGSHKADPAIVAAAVVRAIGRPRPEVVAPAWYRALLMLNRWIPGSVNRWIRHTSGR